MNEEEIIEYLDVMKKYFISLQRYEIAGGLRTIQRKFLNEDDETDITIENMHILLNILINELSLNVDKIDVYEYVTPLLRDEKLKKLFDQ